MTKTAHIEAKILDGLCWALAEHEAGRPVFHKGAAVTFTGRIIAWPELALKFNWLGKYGASPLKRAMDGLVSVGLLVPERDVDKRWTGRYYVEEGI